MSMYDMVDTTPEGYSEGEELSKMFSEDDMSEAFEERDIDVITEEINFYKQQAGMAILEIGKRLVEAKAQLSHGEWLPWLEKKVEFSERSAQQYIRLWKEYGKSATVADLGVRKALVLLALPDTERDSFAGEKHEVNGEEKTAAEMTVKELEKAVAERNTAREEAEQAKADLYAAREAAREARDHVETLRGELEALKNRPTEVAIEQRDATEEQLAAARQELGNPVLVVDSSFRTLAMEPEQPIGIDSWDRILQGEAPQHHDLKQAEAMIENFSARNLTGLQTVPYTEPDGRPVRRMVGPVVAPDDGRNCGGLEIIELEHPFAPEDEVLAQRLLELLQHYLVHAAPTAWRAAPEERFLQELLFCEPAQQSAMQKKLHRFPALEAPPHFYLASIPLSQAHRLTRTNQQALLAHEWPEGWFMQTETAFLLLLPGTGDTAQPEQLLQKLQEVGLRMGQTVILSMPFPSLLQLGTVWRFNQEAAATARDLHCGAGCRSASALYQDVFVRTIAQSANLRAFIHPMLRRLPEYDQAHSTALLHTLCVYLLQEQNLHATARQLFIHRNTLVYRLQRIRTLLQLDLDDAAMRNVLRTGCILLEYYQGAF